MWNYGTLKAGHLLAALDKNQLELACGRPGRLISAQAAKDSSEATLERKHSGRGRTDVAVSSIDRSARSRFQVRGDGQEPVDDAEKNYHSRLNKQVSAHSNPCGIARGDCSLWLQEAQPSSAENTAEDRAMQQLLVPRRSGVVS